MRCACTGDAPATLRAAAMGWHGYFNALDHGGRPLAIAEVDQAVEVLRDGSDPEHLG